MFYWEFQKNIIVYTADYADLFNSKSAKYTLKSPRIAHISRIYRTQIPENQPQIIINYGNDIAVGIIKPIGY